MLKYRLTETDFDDSSVLPTPEMACANALQSLKDGNSQVTITALKDGHEEFHRTFSPVEENAEK